MNSLDKQGTVTLAGNTATVNHWTTNFVGYANVGLGTNTVQIIATDYTANQNSRTNNYQLGERHVMNVKSMGAGATVLKHFAYGYDLAGNRTSEQIGATTNAPVAVSQSSYNSMSQLTSRSVSGGPVQLLVI